MKRPSAAMTAVQAKRSKLNPIVASITDSEAVHEEVRGLLGGSLKIALGEFKDARHPFQSEVIAMAEESMAKIKAALGNDVKAAEVKQAEMIDVKKEKGRRVAVKDKATAEVAKCEAALAGKKGKADAAHQALKEAEGVLKADKKEAGKAEAKAEAAESAKASVVSALGEGGMDLLKAAAGTSSEGKKAVKLISELCKKYKVDSGLCGQFPAVAKKAPEARSEFDQYTMTAVGNALQKTLGEVTAEAATEEGVKAAATAKMEAAAAAVAKAKEVCEGADKEVSEAKAVVRAAEKELKKAEEYINAYWTECQEACTAATDAVKALEDFKTLQGEFADLKDMETPPPEPEEPSEPEEAEAEEAPAAEEAAAAEETVPAETVPMES